MKRTVTTLVIAYTAFVLPISTAYASENSVQQRQYAFSEIEEQLEVADDLADGTDTDWSALMEVSQSLLGHSEVLHDSFPAGSQDGSKAKLAVWEKPEKFNQLLLQMDAGFKTLYQASLNQDASLVQKGIKTAEKTCKSCHRTYRSRW